LFISKQKIIKKGEFKLSTKKENKNNSTFFIILVFLILLSYVLVLFTIYFPDIVPDISFISNQSSKKDRDKTFRMLISSENTDVGAYIKEYCSSKKYDIDIEFDSTQGIIERLNYGEKYDSILIPSSIWTYQIDSKNVSLKNSKSIYLSPVVFGIKKSKAEELGFVGRDVYTKEILDAIEKGNLNFSMSNPLTTNSGASAYFALLYTLANNPVAITEDVLQDEKLIERMKTFFSGVERTAGTEDYLQEFFLKGEYEAVVAYESSIININKELLSQGKEGLYIVYPIDGVAICDNPFEYVDNGDNNKKEIFLDIQSYLLSDESKYNLQKLGRRTWYGGVTNTADKNVFREEWGIDTTKYINDVTFPNLDIIKQALSTYQNLFRKPVYVAFCLDYSGSMRGERFDKLISALKLVLSSNSDFDIRFTSNDKAVIIPFAYSAITYEPEWNSTNYSYDELIDNCESLLPYGNTAAYDGLEKSIETLLKDNSLSKDYNLSIILMTDGEINVGDYSEFSNYYILKNSGIPIYSIMFGDASDFELERIANLSNGKVFDGKGNLEEAFKEVRGYN